MDIELQSWQGVKTSDESVTAGGQLNREDSQDTLNEISTDEIITVCDSTSELDVHIQYKEYIAHNSKRIYNDWKEKSLEALRKI